MSYAVMPPTAAAASDESQHRPPMSPLSMAAGRALA